MNTSDPRIEPKPAALRREHLNENPFAQFTAWFQESAQTGLPDATAMTLCTASAEGRPSSRILLLKKFDERGFVFFTNLESRKAREIAENPNVSLHFTWLPLQRQVSINGVAGKLPTAEVLAYFALRPFGSQLAATISPQSRRVSARALLEAKWEEAKRKFADGKVPLPSFWGGYRVVPREFEFWQGRDDHLHDRFLYTRESGHAWKIERLAP
jgi:pyridoxamine 5'-phosphate oxidase